MVPLKFHSNGAPVVLGFALNLATLEGLAPDGRLSRAGRGVKRATEPGSWLGGVRVNPVHTQQHRFSLTGK